jgi:hypothetical protein
VRLNLPTLAEVQAARRGPIAKGQTRLQKVVAERPLMKVGAEEFKAEVWARDKKHCRCCGRKVQQVLGRVPERGEVHHVHGRGKDLRFEARAALLLCLVDHERVTGKVNEKLIIRGTKTFRMGEHEYIDARAPVIFEKVA